MTHLISAQEASEAEDFEIEQSAYESAAVLRQYELELGIPASRRLDLNRASSSGTNSGGVHGESFEFTVSRLALAHALEALKLPGWAGGLPSSVPALAKLEGDQILARKKRAHRVHFFLSGRELTLGTESGGVSAMYSLPLAEGSSAEPLAFEASIFEVEVAFGLKELRAKHRKEGDGTYFSLTKSPFDGPVTLRYKRSTDSAKDGVLDATDEFGAFRLSANEIEPDCPWPVVEVEPEAEGQCPKELQRALRHVGTFANKQRGSFNTVMVVEGHIYGGAQNYVTSVQSPAIRTSLRLNADQVPAVKSLLGRMAGPVYVQSADEKGVAFLTDGFFRFSVVQPRGKFPTPPVFTKHPDSTGAVLLDHSAALNRAAALEALIDGEGITAIEIDRTDDGVLALFWTTSHFGWGRGHSACRSDLQEGEEKRGRLRTKDLIQALNIQPADAISLELTDRFAIVEVQDGNIIARHFIAYPSPDLGPHPLPAEATAISKYAG